MTAVNARGIDRLRMVPPCDRLRVGKELRSEDHVQAHPQCAVGAYRSALAGA
jgi:hypothetical protein